MLLHFSHDPSSWSSPSFSSTPIQHLTGISDLFSEVSKFQHRTKLYSKYSILLVSCLYLHPICRWKVFFLLNATFAIAILVLILCVHLASFVIMLPKQLKYSTFSSCVLNTLFTKKIWRWWWHNNNNNNNAIWWKCMFYEFYRKLVVLRLIHWHSLIQAKQCCTNGK